MPRQPTSRQMRIRFAVATAGVVLFGWALMVFRAALPPRGHGEVAWSARGTADAALAFAILVAVLALANASVTSQWSARRAATAKGIAKLLLVLWVIAVAVRLALSALPLGALVALCALPGFARWWRGRVLLARAALEAGTPVGILVLSESERWNNFILRGWGPRLPASVVILQRDDERLQDTVAGRVFSHFASGGRRVQNQTVPTIVIRRGVGDPIVVRLRSALVGARRGDPTLLNEREAEISGVLGIVPPLRTTARPKVAPDPPTGS